MTPRRFGSDPREVARLIAAEAPLPFMGFACLMRLAISGLPIHELGTLLTHRAARYPQDANLLMDLATTAFLSLAPDNRAMAFAMQRRALGMQQIYHLPAPEAPALRVLAIMAPGDMTANTPLDCLLEDSDVALSLLYLTPDLPVPAVLPEHDVVFVAVGESGENRATLVWLTEVLRTWPKPVVNAPEKIIWLSRDGVSAMLHDVPGIAIPATARIERAQLIEISSGKLRIEQALPNGGYPAIVRPFDSQGGKGLVKVDAPADLENYLQGNPDDAFFMSRFVDYSRADVLFRKFRVVWIAGKPFACHMAISSHWMIHYVNADMDASAAKRAEEAQFMRDFDADFAQRHRDSLAAINALAGLDYFAIDCAETADGRLLVFELDNAMLVHDTDAPEVYPYKHPQMRRLFDAFRALLIRSARRVADTAQ